MCLLLSTNLICGCLVAIKYYFLGYIQFTLTTSYLHYLLPNCCGFPTPTLLLIYMQIPNEKDHTTVQVFACRLYYHVWLLPFVFWWSIDSKFRALSHWRPFLQTFIDFPKKKKSIPINMPLILEQSLATHHLSINHWKPVNYKCYWFWTYRPLLYGAGEGADGCARCQYRWSACEKAPVRERGRWQPMLLAVKFRAP